MTIDPNVRELLGIARDDFWYYPALVLLIVGCLLSSLPAIVALFGASTVFLVIYQVRSFPKYLRDPTLKQATRLLGIVGNVLLILLQVVVVAAKLVLHFGG